MLAIPLITLQAVIEIAVGGFLAMLIADVTRLVTRGFLASTGIVLLLIGALGLAGEWFLPDPTHLTGHRVDPSWIQPSLRLTAVFLGLFLVYLVAVYLRPPVLHLVVGVATAGAGLAALATAANVFPTPLWGAWGTGAAFLLSALTLGTVATAMLLGHFYLVSPNLSTRPLFILLALAGAGMLGQVALGVAGLLALAGQAGVAGRHDVLAGDYSVVFWAHYGIGVLLPLAVVAMTAQSARLRSLMSATGLLYVAVVLTLVGQVTGRVIFYGGNLPL